MGTRLDALKSALRSRGRQERGMMGYTTRSMAQPPERNTVEWLRAYISNPRLAPVRKIATDLAAVPGKLYRGTGDDRREVTTHPFLELCAQPNPLPELTLAAIWKLLEIWFQLKGEALCVIERGRGGLPSELWPVPPHWIAEIPHRGCPAYVLQNTEGQRVQVPIRDVFVLRDLNPLEPYGRGMGQAEAVADEVEAYEYATKFSKTVFFNNARADYFICAPGATEEQIERFLATLDKRHRGPWNAHRPGVIPKEVTIHRLSDSPREMDFVASRKDLRDTVNSHWNVPPELLGIVENSNRATASAAKAIYAENVLTPQLLIRQAAINRQLLPQFEEGLVWEYDDIIPQDEQYQLQVANEGISRCAITINEWRERMGFESIEGGDAFVVPVNAVIVPRDDLLTSGALLSGNLTGPPSPERPAAVGVAAAGKAKKRAPSRAAVRRALDRARAAHERGAKQVVYRCLRQQHRAILSALGTERKAGNDGWAQLLAIDIGTELAAAVDRVEDVLRQCADWDGLEVFVRSGLAPVWQSAFDAGAELAAEVYGLSGVTQPRLTRHLLSQGASRVRGITETTRGSLARAIAEGLMAGDGRQQLIERVQEAMPGVSPGRAAVIAANEVHISLMSGNFDMLKSAGYATKTWLTAGDSDVRGSHRRLHGVTIPMDARFENGLLYPGDPAGSPAEVIGCRCDLIAGEEPGTVQEPGNRGILRAGGDENNFDMDGLEPAQPERIAGLSAFTPEAARDALDRYSDRLNSQDYETALIVTRSGQVYTAKGHLNGVNIHGLPDEELHGAYMSHNHPDSVTRYSFSAYDLSEALKYRFGELRGFDSKYEYVMRVLPDTLEKEDYIVRHEFSGKYSIEAMQMAYDNILDMDMDAYHFICQRMAEDYGFYYERRAR